MIKTVGFIGLGKLGLPCAEAMATKYIVNGYDITYRTSDSVNVTTLEETVTAADIIFVAIQTPHEDKYDGSVPSSNLPPKDFDYTAVQQCFKQIDKIVRPDQLVVLISTTLPGTVRKNLRLYLTKPRFIYNPYLIAMGSVRWDMVNPEMVIIGTQDGEMTEDANDLIEFYKPLMENDPKYSVGTWDEAEAIKIFYNTFISMKVSMVNMIQDVAIRNGNMDVDVVTDALKGATMRITGPKYMTAGMGDAGPCHPRDNIALRWLAQDMELGYDMFGAIMDSREKQAYQLATKLYELSVPKKQKVYIHGKAYKPGVDITDGSYSLLVGNYLAKMGYPPTYIDPLTGDMPEDLNVPIHGVILLAHNAAITYDYTNQEALKKVELYVTIRDGSTIVDPWRTYPNDQPERFHVIHYGNSKLDQK
jgi:UDPglucose 6-dehydrogenase